MRLSQKYLGLSSGPMCLMNSGFMPRFFRPNKVADVLRAASEIPGRRVILLDVLIHWSTTATFARPESEFAPTLLEAKKLNVRITNHLRSSTYLFVFKPFCLILIDSLTR